MNKIKVETLCKCGHRYGVHTSGTDSGIRYKCQIKVKGQLCPCDKFEEEDLE